MKRAIVGYLAAGGCRGDGHAGGDGGARDILKLQPDGVFLSERPRRPRRGSPMPVEDGAEAARQDAPVRHLSRPPAPRPRAGAWPPTSSKFGHRGANHPVKDLTTGDIEITTQNHGFAVRDDGPAARDPGVAGHARQLKRRHRRRPRGAGALCLFGAVPPPRVDAGTARLAASLRALRRRDAGASRPTRSAPQRR